MSSLQLPLLYLRGKKLQGHVSAVPVSLVNAAELFPSSSQSGGKRPQHQYFNCFNTIFPTLKINPWRGIICIKNYFPLLNLNVFEGFFNNSCSIFFAELPFSPVKAINQLREVEVVIFFWFGTTLRDGLKREARGKIWQFPGLTPALQTAGKSP